MTTKEDIEKILWEACNSFRGNIDSSSYKDYILSMLFIKYLSDIVEEEKEKLKKEYGNNQERIERSLQMGRFYIPEESSFEYLYKNRKSQNIGQKINNAIKEIENAKNGKLRNIFGEIDFNSQQLGDMKEKITLLNNILEDFNNLDLRPSHLEDEDTIGNAYMYMLTKFAGLAGKKGGEFFTPIEVSEILAKIVQPKENDRIYDPTCGSGTLLIKAFKEISSKKAQIYGQEKNYQTWGLCQMNMFIHNIDDAIIYHGDTISNPQNLENEKLMQFDCIVANPPFSLKKWANGYATDSNDKNFKMSKEYDVYKRFDWGIPPKDTGDYAFILHMLHSLKNTGKMAIIAPHGVLYREKSEGKIREKILQHNLLDAVIGLPKCLFYGTDISACILVFKKNKTDKNILFIDASREYKKCKNKNKLTKENINKITKTYINKSEIEKYSRVVKIKEIEENDYNLNISRYIDNFIDEEEININEINEKLRKLDDSIRETEEEINKMIKELIEIDSK